MTASLSRPTAEELRRGLRLTGTEAETVTPPVDGVRRVVSVSPHSVEVATNGEPTDMEKSETVFITPRVVDEKRMEAWRASVDALVRQSSAESGRIRELLEEMKGREAQATNASRQLQERLSLGARMLKAFQTQIEQAQAMVTEASDAEARLRTLDEQIEERVKSISARVESMESRIDERLSQVDARIEASDRRISEAQIRMDQFAVESERAASRQRDSAVELKALFAQVEQVRGFLAEEIVSANEEVDSFAHALAHPCAELQASLNSAQAAEERLRDLVLTAGSVSSDFEAIRSTRPEVDDLVAKLEQWKPVLLSDGKDMISERVHGAAHGIRLGVSQELGKFIQSLRLIADHAEHTLRAEDAIVGEQS